MLKVYGTHVCITPMYEDTRTPSGLYKPDQAIPRCNQGIVRYIGPKVKDIKPGMHVFFSAYTGSILRLEDEGDIIIIPERFISAVLVTSSYEIPGLYFKDNDGKYWTCNYEFAHELIKMAAKETDWFRAAKVVELDKPTNKEMYEYDEDEEVLYNRRKDDVAKNYGIDEQQIKPDKDGNYIAKIDQQKESNPKVEL